MFFSYYHHGGCIIKKLVLIITFLIYSSTAQALTIQSLADTETNPVVTDSIPQKIYSDLTGNDLNEESETVGSTKGFISSYPLSYTSTRTNDLSSGIESAISKWQASVILDSSKLDGVFSWLNQFISLPVPGSNLPVSQIEQQDDN